MCEGCVGVWERGGVVGVCAWVMGWGAGVRTRGNAGMLVAVGVTLLLLVFLVFCLGFSLCLGLWSGWAN